MSDGSLNLTVPRSGKSVWDEPDLSRRLSAYDRERWMTAACGSTLAMLGIRQRGFGGGLLVAAGSVLAVRAAMGRHDLGTARDYIDRTLRAWGWCKDVVQDASEESFPASDSPAWTGSGAR